jgi:PAS domain S-box-containing protein
MDGSARLDAELAETRVARQEQPNMEFPRQRVAVAFAASAVGIVVTWLTKNPLGLLAPTATLFLFARGRTVLLLHAVSAIGLVGALFVAASYAGAAHDLAAAWAAFFALALCIGAIVATSASASPNAGAMPAAIRSTTPEQAPSYPVVGPSLREKAAPRHAPFVSISTRDDKATAALLATVSFWGGMPVHMRYWRHQPDGRYRWVESRSEPLREPSGTRRWSGVTTDVDDQRLGQEPPKKAASNPPNDEDAVRAAKLVESLLGNAWAFDAAGRPTYLTPLAQTFVAVTLEEFQAAVDEGHTFFKRTAHPDDYDRISAAWRHSLQTGDPFFLDRRVRRASGIHEWNRTGFVPTRDEQGRITGWYGSMIDLDSHRIAEAELRERERELLQLVNMVPSHLWRLAPDGEPIFFSKRMVDFLGLDVADIDRPGMSRLEALIETVHPDDAAEFRDTLRRCFATGESFTMRYRLRRADGVHRWMSSRAEPMRDQDGRIVQWYGLCHDIDDQVHAEEALRQSERHLRELVGVVPVAIARLEPDGDPTFFNKRLIDFLGLDVTDMAKPGMSRLAAAIVTALHPDDAAGFAEALNHSLVTGEPFVRKYRLRRADGVYRWVEGRIEPLRDPDGVIVQWYGVTFDIDDQMRLYSELEEREARIRRLVDSDIIGIVIWDLDGRLVDANDAFLRMVQYERADLQAGLGWFDMTPPEWQEVHAREEAEELARTGMMQAREKEYFRKDGSRVPVLIGAACFEGQSRQGVAYILDLTERRRAEAALRDRERELAQLVDMLPVYIRRLTPEGEPIFFNKRLTDFIGVGLAEIGTAGTSRLWPAVENFVHPDEAAKVVAALRRAVATGEGYAMRYRMRGADGIYRWIETRAEPLRNQDGTIAQWYSVSIDIEDEVRARQAEAALRETSDRLAKATQAASLAELSASIAHEVNQPLAAIVANSHACQRWLSAEPTNVERAKITVERIIRDANSAADVVSRIRALFRQSVEPRSSTTLSNVIAEARSLMAEEAARRRIRMDVDVESNLPPVAFDRVQIQQVLINLIRNGFDAMESAGDDRVLGVRAHRNGDSIQIEISDRGVGIEFPDRIFEPFFTTKQDGMGMGLAICRSIVESHGGRLAAEKNEPRGATFIFTLPVEAKTWS